MPQDLANYIIAYGYITIFSLVFLQEIGVPNPVTNELVLLFSGYLAYTHQLNLALVLLTVILADAIGTTLLFTVFYFLGDWFLKKKPRWVPLGKIEKLKQKIEERGQWGIFAGRLLPYIRGYTSVAAGLLRIPPKKFVTAVVLSATLWSGGYVLAGFLLGNKWNEVISKIGFGKLAFAILGIIILIFYIIPLLVKKYSLRKKSVA